MAYYRVCPDCGAFLDPNESCDCHKRSEQLRRKYEQLTTVSDGGQIEFGGLCNDLQNWRPSCQC